MATRSIQKITTNHRAWTLRILLVSVIGGAILTWITCPGCRMNPVAYGYVSLFCTTVWFTMWMGNGLIAEYIGKYISWVDQPVKRLIVGFVAALVYSIGGVILLMLLFEFALNLNLGDYWMVIRYTIVLTTCASLFFHSRAFLQNWRLSALNAEKFEKESAIAQYESLKNQVNPHFLFNSLNALTGLVHEDPDKAVKFIKRLSEVYRYVLDTRELDVVPLSEEVKFLESYMYLQDIRFDKSLIVEIDLDVAAKVPPLALQLLAENAVKHNIISRDRPLTIRFYHDNGYIVVENTLQRKDAVEESSSGIGLENIRRRYSFLTSEDVIVTDAEGKFSVRLPMLNDTVL